MNPSIGMPPRGIFFLHFFCGTIFSYRKAGEEGIAYDGFVRGFVRK